MRTSSSASPEPTITTGKHSIPQHGHIARCPLFLSTVWAKRRRAIDALSTSPFPSMRPRLHRRRLKAGAGLGTEPVSARPETGRRINRCMLGRRSRHARNQGQPTPPIARRRGCGGAGSSRCRHSCHALPNAALQNRHNRWLRSGALQAATRKTAAHPV